MDVVHTAICVSDLEDARAFFVDALGLEEKWSFTAGDTENVFVGGEHGEIQLRYDPDRPDPEPDGTTIDHLAVTVDDVDAETERMVDETGCAVVDGPVTVDAAGSRVSFIEGPDGYVVELVEPLE
ncbi:VOC family protein [Natrarchaeobius chitinivorans]|uniref:VOC family protein n=1 Tax=Natrarchaeobius chitinivorans TaxID=1679083 RepID=A0A3N6MF69_NATCH|nr:VOC family protein [Natrarchaeobius chitinivorans]RQG92536.1 VOC family protein [Natrarchaeobius chitinivorans]